MLPGYVSRLQSLVMRVRPAIGCASIFGENVTDAQVSDLVKQGAGWAAHLRQVALVAADRR